MAGLNSFDITSTIDLQEVDNADNQARKELGQRYDFKGSAVAIDLDQKANTLTLTAQDNFKIESVWDVLQTRLVRRNVAVKNMKRGDIETAAGGTVKQVINFGPDGGSHWLRQCRPVVPRRSCWHPGRESAASPDDLRPVRLRA